MSKTITIKNDNLTVEISTFGAELQSVRNSDGVEYIWDGNPDFWTGRAPILFPICGGLKEDKYILDGQEYSLPKHGFGRTSEFECEKAEDSSAVFLLKATNETKKAFPFDFELRVIYILDGNTLDVRYEVKNLSDKTMYFSIGAHEGYACPGGIEEYSVCFDEPQTLNSSLLVGNLLDFDTKNIITDSTILQLKQEYFAVDALVFTDVKFSKATLRKNDGTREITVEFPEHNYLLLWTKPNAEYICIEPWCGIPDRVGSGYDISEKEGIISLSADGTYEVHHTVSFDK